MKAEVERHAEVLRRLRWVEAVAVPVTNVNLPAQWMIIDRTASESAVLHALNQAVSRLHAYESKDPDTPARAQPPPSDSAGWLSSPSSSRATALATIGPQGSDLGGATWT